MRRVAQKMRRVAQNRGNFAHNMRGVAWSGGKTFFSTDFDHEEPAAGVVAHALVPVEVIGKACRADLGAMAVGGALFPAGHGCFTAVIRCSANS